MKTGMGGWVLLVLLLCCLPYSNADNGVVFSIITKIVTGTRPELGEDAICALCKLNNGEECREFQPSAEVCKECFVGLCACPLHSKARYFCSILICVCNNYVAIYVVIVLMLRIGFPWCIFI